VYVSDDGKDYKITPSEWGGGIHKDSRESFLSENFNCRFLYFEPYYFNGALYAYEKHCFS